MLRVGGNVRVATGRCSAVLLLDAAIAIAEEVCAASDDGDVNVLHVLLDLEARHLLPSRYTAELVRRVLEVAAGCPSVGAAAVRGPWSDASVDAAVALLLQQRSSDGQSPMDILTSCRSPRLVSFLKKMCAIGHVRRRQRLSKAVKSAMAVAEKAAGAASVAAKRARVHAQRAKGGATRKYNRYDTATKETTSSREETTSVCDEIARIAAKLTSGDATMSNAARNGLEHRLRKLEAEMKVCLFL